MEIKNKKIIILGGTGFIGRNLINYFSKKKFKISATYNRKPPFINKNVKWMKVDLCKSKDVKNLFKSFNIVIQAAATTSGSRDIIHQPHIHITDNAIMNSLILKEVYDSNVEHFLFFSCVLMYPPSSRFVDEKKKIEEFHPQYFGAANTKIYIEKICEFFSRISKTKFTIIRHSNVFGPHDKFDLDKSHIFGATVTKVGLAKKIKKEKIEVWGDGKEKRDLLYIDDLINFVWCALNNQNTNYEIFNCGSMKSFSVTQIVKNIINVMHPKCKIIYNNKRPSIKMSLSLNCEKAKKHIGWSPKVSFVEGVKKTAEWWTKEFLPKIKTKDYIDKI